MGRSLRCRCLSPRGPSCEHHDRAREVDPDVSDSGEDEALDLNDGTDSASRELMGIKHPADGR